MCRLGYASRRSGRSQSGAASAPRAADARRGSGTARPTPVRGGWASPSPAASDAGPGRAARPGRGVPSGRRSGLGRAAGARLVPASPASRGASWPPGGPLGRFAVPRTPERSRATRARLSARNAGRSWSSADGVGGLLRAARRARVPTVRAGCPRDPADARADPAAGSRGVTACPAGSPPARREPHQGCGQGPPPTDPCPVRAATCCWSCRRPALPAMAAGRPTRARRPRAWAPTGLRGAGRRRGARRPPRRSPRPVRARARPPPGIAAASPDPTTRAASRRAQSWNVGQAANDADRQYSRWCAIARGAGSGSA